MRVYNIYLADLQPPTVDMFKSMLRRRTRLSVSAPVHPVRALGLRLGPKAWMQPHYLLAMLGVLAVLMLSACSPEVSPTPAEPTATPSPEAATVVPTPPATATPEPTSTPTPNPAVLIVKSSTLNVRSGPGLVYPVIGQLKKGDVVHPVGLSPDKKFYRIPWKDDKGQEATGWVSADASLVDANSDAKAVAMVPQSEIPPTPTPSPTPTPVPREIADKLMAEALSSCWGAKSIDEIKGTGANIEKFKTCGKAKLQKVIVAYPDHEGAHRLLAWGIYNGEYRAAVASGDDKTAQAKLEEAKKEYELAAALYGKLGDKRVQSKMLANAAFIYAVEGNTAKACELFKQAQALDPQNTDAADGVEACK